MTTPTQPPADRITHPGWCWPTFCAQHDNGELQHESEGTAHGMRECELELALVQAHDCDGPGDVELRFELTSTVNTGQVVCGYLTLDEARQWARAFTVELERAQWQAGPIVHRVVAS